MLVEHGGTLVTLEGRAAGSLLPALLPLLDGTRTVDDVGAAVGERARPAVDRALELLAHHRLLVDGPIADGGDADASSAASYAASVTRRISPAGAVAALAGASVAVVGSGRQADEVARQLRLVGIGQVERPPGTTVGRPHLVVAAPPPHDTALLPEVNRACLAEEPGRKSGPTTIRRPSYGSSWSHTRPSARQARLTSGRSAVSSGGGAATTR